jgi:hypothetical protein
MKHNFSFMVLRFIRRFASEKHLLDKAVCLISSSGRSILRAAISLKYLLNYPHGAEQTAFKTLYFSENLVAPGIEHGPLDL